MGVPLGNQTVEDETQDVRSPATPKGDQSTRTETHGDDFRPHFMVIPALACPAECSYCFGPRRGPVMTANTMAATLDFMAAIVKETKPPKIKVTFHGGEPLMAGHAFWRQALDGLAARFSPRRVEIGVQSNLWLLDDAFCEMFRKHAVEIGTSVDGPAEITDAQRGTGYFDRTLRGIRRARSWGLNISCIATFTPQSVSRWSDIFDFFLNERLSFSIHASVPHLEAGTGGFSLDTQQYGNLLHSMLDRYIEHRRELSISSLDQMCQGVGCGEGRVCTFRACLGMFLAIDPNGDIFPCQRFCGRPTYRLGNLSDRPTMSDLLCSQMARRMAARHERIRQNCAHCKHLDYCNGGCVYNAWAGENAESMKDPYCAAYQRTFDEIQSRLLNEMATDENIAAIAEGPFTGRGNPLLRRGPLIELTREGAHPSQVSRTARRVVAAVELAKGPDIPQVAARLVNMGLCRTLQSAQASVEQLRLSLQPTGRLNNLYLHVTLQCNLNCTHCYARADPRGNGQGVMSVDVLSRLLQQAKDASFRQVIITGGEPLVHPQRLQMLDMLVESRGRLAPMNLVLRTNFATNLDGADLRQIAAAFDQVVVSVDGGKESHDARRGIGNYDAVLVNLKRYRKVAGELPYSGELSLAAVLRVDDIREEPGAAVRALASDLGVRRTRFRPILPLGRAKDWDEPPTSEALGGYADPMEAIEKGFQPVASCGLGQNLYVEPSGEAFPCYAYHRPHSHLGNVISHGLHHVLKRDSFQNLRGHCVDTNPKCRVCDVRYLCGGACRAWGGDVCQSDLDAPPPECEGLRARATALYAVSLDYLGNNHCSPVRRTKSCTIRNIEKEAQRV